MQQRNRRAIRMTYQYGLIKTGVNAEQLRQQAG